jgi:acyl dehydratase
MSLNHGLVGQEFEPVEVSWTSKDAMLYALGVGAGAPDPLDELSFTTENTHGVPQRVLPTFVASVMGSGGVPLGDFDPGMLLHGAQTIEVFALLLPEGVGRARWRIAAFHDKGSAAVAVMQCTLEDSASGKVLARTESSAFIRGEGGFGGSRGDSEPWSRPQRPADHIVEYATRPDQALLYRLSGDRNPLHSDPTAATLAGFGRPILHGMASYGFAGRALLHTLCDSDPASFGQISARFASTVRPGDSLATQIWDDGGGQYRFVVTTGKTIVLDHGLFARRAA